MITWHASARLRGKRGGPVLTRARAEACQHHGEGTTTHDSTACDKTSKPEHAVMAGFIVSVTTGSMIAMLGLFRIPVFKNQGVVQWRSIRFRLLIRRC